MTKRPKVLYISHFSRGGGIMDRIRGLAAYPRLTGQDGFFRGALHCGFDATEDELSGLSRRLAGGGFDCVVVNLKCRPDRKGLDVADIEPIRAVSVPKILAVTNAEPGNMPGDAMLDLFDVVMKREPFIDRDRYDLSPTNRSKIHATMLACPLVPARLSNVRRIDPAASGFTTPCEQEDTDVFFSGASTSRERIDVLNRLKDEPFRLDAAIQPRQFKDEIPPGMTGPLLKQRDFIDKVRRAKINLALSGYGPFTFRHLELWCLCAFGLSTPRVRELELPVPAKAGEHFVCFENPDDLADKCRYYLERPQERHAIARAGRKLFDEHYSFEKHGQALRRLFGGGPS